MPTSPSEPDRRRAVSSRVEHRGQVSPAAHTTLTSTAERQTGQRTRARSFILALHDALPRRSGHGPHHPGHAPAGVVWVGGDDRPADAYLYVERVGFSNGASALPIRNFPRYGARRRVADRRCRPGQARERGVTGPETAGARLTLWEAGIAQLALEVALPHRDSGAGAYDTYAIPEPAPTTRTRTGGETPGAAARPWGRRRRTPRRSYGR